MAESPNNIEQKISLVLDEQVKGKGIEKHLQSIAKLIKQAEKAFKQFEKRGKTSTKMLAAVDKSTKRLGQQQKKLQAQIKKSTQSVAKQNQTLRKSTEASTKAAKSSSAFGLSLRSIVGIVSVGAGVGIAKVFSSWVTDLGLLEARAKSLAFSFRDISKNLPSKRGQELFVQFAGQGGLSRRLSSDVEIQGLQKLREELSKKLGEGFGTQLALQLTASFGKSNTELQKFLASASVNVEQALRQFETRDIQAFSHALSAVAQKNSEITETAVTMETAWRQIKEATEVAFRDFVERHGADVQTAVQGIADGIISAINWTRQLGSDMSSVITFILDGFAKVQRAGEAFQLLTGDDTAIRERNRREAEIRRVRDQISDSLDQTIAFQVKGNQREAAGEPGVKGLRELEAESRAEAKRAQERLNLLLGKVPKLTLNFAKNMERVKREQEKAAAAARKQREEFEKMATPAERVAVLLENISAPKALENLRLDVIQSRLEAAQSSPIGFGAVFQATLDAREKLNDLLAINRREQELVKSLGLEREDQETRMLKLQIEQNRIIQKRNTLLRNQTRGFLDFLVAQAGASGRFSKIIIQQDRNIGIALNKGIAKQNRFLGATGDEAARVNVSPVRFSGNMETDRQALQQRQEQFKKVWAPFLKGLREVIVPPQEALSIATSRALRSRPRRVATTTVKAAGGNTRADNVTDQLQEMLKTDKAKIKQTANLIVLMGGQDEPEGVEGSRPGDPGVRTNLGTN